MKKVMFAVLFLFALVAAVPAAYADTPSEWQDTRQGAPTSVPEPGTWLLVGAGLTGLAIARRKLGSGR